MDNNRQDSPVNNSHKTESIESIIGKYALPVIATVLILIGVCLFAATIWETMPDAFKAGMVFLLAAVIAAAGLLLGKKHQMRVFRVSTVAVALAIAYVDILCMFLLWNIIGLIPAVVLILLWIGLCAFLSCSLAERTFHFCSIAGLYITSLLCYDLFEADSSGIVIILALAAAFAALTVTYKLRFKTLSFLFGIAGALTMINLIAFSGSTCIENSSCNIAIRILIYSVSCIYAFFYCKTGYDDIQNIRLSERIFGCINTFVISLSLLFYVSTIWNRICAAEYLPLFAVILLFCIKKETRTESIIGGFIPLLTVFGSISDILLNNVYPGMVIFALIPLAFLYFDNSFSNSILAIITQSVLAFSSTLSAGLLDMDSEPENLLFIIIAFFIVLGCNIIYMSRQQRYYYSPAFITVLVTGLAVGIALSSIFEGEIVGVLTSFFLLALAAGNTLFIIRKSSSADITRIDLLIYGLLFQIYLLVVYSDAVAPAAKIFYVLLLAADLALISYSVVYGSAKKLFPSLVCMSLLLVDYFVVVYQSCLEKYGFIISVGLLLIAACFIIHGFRRRSRTARLYGLVMVFVSVAKMLLADIIITDQIMRVACLIGAGVICLIISFLYNKMEKKAG